MPTKAKKEVKKQTTNAGLKKYAEPRNKTGKGRFTGADDPRRNKNGQRSAAAGCWKIVCTKLVAAQRTDIDLNSKTGRDFAITHKGGAKWTLNYSA